MLAEHHRQYLLDAAINLDLAEDHGVQTVEDGIVFPYRGPSGRVVEVFKPDDPGDGPKYVSPKGQAPGLNVIHDAGEGAIADLLIVEGTKQALAAASHAPPQYSVAGMNGCWGWSHDKRATPDLDMVDGRRVFLCFDADRHTNPDVAKAARYLVRACRAAGATEVYFMDLGEDATGSEGLDDVLARLDDSWRTWWLEGRIDAAEPAPEEEETNPLIPFLYDSNDLSAIPPPEPLIKRGVLDKATVAVLAGKFGTYKTFVALSWAGCLATGTPWADHEVVEPTRVLYVAAEGVGGFAARIRAWRNGFIDGRHIDPGMLSVYARPVNLLDREQVEALKELTDSAGYGLVVVDTLHRCAPGVEENSSSGIGGIGVPMSSLFGLRDDTKASVLVLHHTGHSGKRARGSSAIEDDADAAWVIKLAGDGEDRGPKVQRTLVHRKSKDGELHTNVSLKLEVDDDSGSAYIKPTSEISPEISQILSWLSANKIPSDWGRERILPLKPQGLPGSKHQIEDAIKFRKQRAKIMGKEPWA